MARLFKRSSAASEAAEEPARKAAELRPDPDRIGISGSVPFVRMPAPDRIFSDRAARFTVLAAGHPLGGYLDFLARIARGQAASVAATAEAAAAVPDAALRIAHGMPPLTAAMLREDPAFLAGLDRLLALIDLDGAPEAALSARAALRAANPEDRLEVSEQVFAGAFPLERLAECVFVAAALQVYLGVQASRLTASSLKAVADGVCPACGGAPVASLVVAWTPADKARYCSCSLCGTLWNQVRIRCTACGSGEGVSYYGLDEVSKDVQVETCTTCHSYIKHLHQHRDPALDPIADDVASYGLDLKIAEEGFRRAGLNPLFIA